MFKRKRGAGLLIALSFIIALAVSSFALTGCGDDTAKSLLTADGCTISWESQGEGLTYTVTAADKEAGTKVVQQTTELQLDLAPYLSLGKMYDVTLSYTLKKKVITSAPLTLLAAKKLEIPSFTIAGYSAELTYIFVSNEIMGLDNGAEGYIVSYSGAADSGSFTALKSDDDALGTAVALPIKTAGEYTITVTALGNGVTTVNSDPSPAQTAYFNAAENTLKAPSVLTKSDEYLGLIVVCDTAAEHVIFKVNNNTIRGEIEDGMCQIMFSSDVMIEGVNTISMYVSNRLCVSDVTTTTLNYRPKQLPTLNCVYSGDVYKMFVGADETIPSNTKLTLTLEGKEDYPFVQDFSSSQKSYTLYQSKLLAIITELTSTFEYGKTYNLKAYLTTEASGWEQSETITFAFSLPLTGIEAPSFTVDYTGIEFTTTAATQYELGVTELNTPNAKEQLTAFTADSANEPVHISYDFVGGKTYSIRLGVKNGVSTTKVVSFIEAEKYNASWDGDTLKFNKSYNAAKSLKFVLDGKTVNATGTVNNQNQTQIYSISASQLKGGKILEVFTASPASDDTHIDSAPVTYTLTHNAPFSIICEKDGVVSADGSAYTMRLNNNSHSSDSKGKIAVEYFGIGYNSCMFYNRSSVTHTNAQTGSITVPYTVTRTITRLEEVTDISIVENASDETTVLEWEHTINSYYDVKLVLIGESTEKDQTLIECTTVDARLDITEFVKDTRGGTLKLTVTKHSNNANTMSSDAAEFIVYNPDAPALSFNGTQFNAASSAYVHFSSSIPNIIDTRFAYRQTSSKDWKYTSNDSISMNTLEADIADNNRPLYLKLVSDGTNYLSSPVTEARFVALSFHGSSSIPLLVQNSIRNSGVTMFAQVGAAQTGIPVPLTSEFYLSNRMELRFLYNNTVFAEGSVAPTSDRSYELDASQYATTDLLAAFHINDDYTNIYLIKKYAQNDTFGELPQPRPQYGLSVLSVTNWGYVSTATGERVVISENTLVKDHISAGSTLVLTYETSDVSSFEYTRNSVNYTARINAINSTVKTMYIPSSVYYSNYAYTVTAIALTSRNDSVETLYIPHTVSSVSGLGQLRGLKNVYVDKFNPYFKSVNGKLCDMSGKVIYDPAA